MASSIIINPSSVSDLLMLKGGANRITLFPQPRVSKPRSKARSTTRSRNSSSGVLDLRSFTNSTPIISPIPRTSPMDGWRTMISLRASSVYCPTSAAFSMYSFSIKSMVASAAAHAIGLPPKVFPCAPFGQSTIDFRAIMAPKGIPEAIPFAAVMISGSTSKFSMAHHFPVRPIPDRTSSAIRRMSCLSQSFRRAGKNPGGGMMYPPSPWMGSTRIPATSSAGKI